jgi:transmembrane sensor
MESTRQQIEERAAQILRKRDSGEWTATDEAELAEWLQASIAHRVAFLRTEAAWEQMGRIKALGAGLPRRKVPTPEELSAAHLRKHPRPAVSRRDEAIEADADPQPGHVAPNPRSGRFRRTALATAASMLIGSCVAFGAYQLWFSGERYTTPIGGIASVPLEDGSLVTLNTRSQVRVMLDDQVRRIDLAQGEAFFEVARDNVRPFVVRAGDQRVIALGTKFSVRRDGDSEIRVVVTEGRVRIEKIGAAGSGAAGIGAARTASTGLASTAVGTAESETILSAGGIARARDTGIVVQNRTPPEAEEMLSWRSGYVVFKDTPLAAAVAEFNRYNAHQIVIQDPAIAGMTLTGKFRATNNETFVSLLEQTFHIHVRHAADSIVLTDAGP